MGNRNLVTACCPYSLGSQKRKMNSIVSATKEFRVKVNLRHGIIKEVPSIEKDYNIYHPPIESWISK